jgi:magnesium transporter
VAQSADISSNAATIHATMNVPTASPEELVQELRSGLVGSDFDVANEVVVLEDGVAVGLVTLESLLACPEGRRVSELMTPDPVTVEESTDQEVVAHRMVENDGGCVVVAGPQGQFRGLICPERMLQVLWAEHEQDLARIGGYLSGADRSRSAASESVPRRLWHRLPWLLLGLGGAMCSALIMGAFDARLEANVLIALFVPAIVYMADAVGTQTETVLIRALAAGVTTRTIVGRELLTGAIIGVAIGAAFFAFALIGWGDVDVAAAVGIALVASSTIATGVAMVLPTIFQRYGVDPAFGSGPLATVIQDLLSILTYFAVVVLLVG